MLLEVNLVPRHEGITNLDIWKIAARNKNYKEIKLVGKATTTLKGLNLSTKLLFFFFEK